MNIPTKLKFVLFGVIAVSLGFAFLGGSTAATMETPTHAVETLKGLAIMALAVGLAYIGARYAPAQGKLFVLAFAGIVFFVGLVKFA